MTIAIGVFIILLVIAFAIGYLAAVAYVLSNREDED